MLISFTKISPTHHLFKIVRGDGSTEEQSFETKSLMPHDLIHYCYESSAQLQDGFYGLLAQGKSLASFMEGKPTPELLATEMIVGPLTSYLTKNISEEAMIGVLQNMSAANTVQLPLYITLEFLKEVKEKYSTVANRWRMLPHHVPFELEWVE